MSFTQQMNTPGSSLPPKNEELRGQYSLQPYPMVPTAHFTSYMKALEHNLCNDALSHPAPFAETPVSMESSYHSTAQEMVGAQQRATDEDAYSPIDTSSLLGKTSALSMAPIAATPNYPEACFMVPFWPQHIAEPSVSATHGANAINADASSTQEDLVNTVAVHPAVPFVQPSLQGIRAVERSSPHTEIICNELGEALLVCPCGDSFSLQRGAVERHYDEKHAIDKTCPWRDRGCTSSAQDVKGHIRDTHCLTYFACPVCLRSDFGCERSMKKHWKACKKQKTGFVICAKCTTVCSSRAALAVHVGYCVSDWMMPQ